MSLKPPALKDYEKESPLWWLQKHKGSAAYLIYRLHQIIETNSPETRTTIENMMRAQLPAFAEEAGVNLDEVNLD